MVSSIVGGELTICLDGRIPLCGAIEVAIEGSVGALVDKSLYKVVVWPIYLLSLTNMDKNVVIATTKWLNSVMNCDSSDVATQKLWD